MEARAWVLVILVAGCGSPRSNSCERLGAQVMSEALRMSDGRSDEARCERVYTGATRDVLSSGDAVGTLRAFLTSHDWSEVLSRAADGPGTTVFVFEKGSDACEISAGAPAYLDGGEIVVSDEYTLVIRCVQEGSD